MFGRHALVVFLLTLAGSAAPSGAWASCGDWLVHPLGDPLWGDSGVGRDGPAPVPERPCDGPLCRQSPTQSPLPWVPVDSRLPDLASWSGDCIDLQSSVERFAGDDLWSLPSGHAQGIERPPRS
jgi:hypothetical protein